MSGQKVPSIETVRKALGGVVDPCSVGRGVPAGITDMGMVKSIVIAHRPAGGIRVDLEMRLTSPGCTFQLYFDEEIRTRVTSLTDIDEVAVTWSHEFDWSDEDMSADLKGRLREKRRRLLEIREVRSTAAGSDG
ncbi:metal-sulfur cluster assembly factor [Herbiconiux sp. P17]|uniref:metal-sulfur cluster assembly factor n=1 Tax=Herbiconiux wuyangfengii TaxID=3342794 RepID=UPI0035B7330D